MNKKFYSKASSVLLLTLLIFSMMGCIKKKPKEIDYMDLSIRDYESSQGMVTSASPYATKAGLDILKSGGNAFDAAVAVSFCLNVVEPNASGIGGGGLMVGYNAKTKQYVYYNFREFAPINATIDKFQNNYTTSGIKSIGVPTEVAGVLSILDDFGSMARQTVMKPAIDYANNGFKVTKELAKAIKENSDLVFKSFDETESVFTSDGIEMLKEGEVLKQTNLANTLSIIAEKGKEGFYKGEIADKILDVMAKNGGLITQEDLDYALNNYPKKLSPLSGTYKDYQIITPSTPSSGGIILIECLNMLETLPNLKGLDHNSPEYINSLATALQLAYGDQVKYVADDIHNNIPYTELMSKQYARDRFKVYKENKAYLGTKIGDSYYGDPYQYVDKTSNNLACNDASSHNSTTSFSAVDKEGSYVSITKTINSFFGSGFVPDDTGFFLNNEMKDFSTNAESINCIEPLKQPVSYMMPTIVLKNNNPLITLGSPGGSRIPAAILQVFLNMVEFNMNIQEAIVAPRIYSFTTKDEEADINLKKLDIEKQFSDTVINDLKAMGYDVIIHGSENIDLYFGGVQGISFLDNRSLHGGADPRRDGKALGY